MPTTTSGIEYPASTGHVRIWEHLQTLAETADVALQAVATDLDTAEQVAIVQLQLPANQSIPNNTQTAIAFGASSELMDSHNYHSTSSNTSRVTPTKAGIYRSSFHLLWENNATGERRAYVGKNGTAYKPVSRLGEVPNLAVSHSVSRFFSINGSGDYLEAMVLQTSGGGLNVTGTATDTDTFATLWEVAYVRPLI